MSVVPVEKKTSWKRSKRTLIFKNWLPECRNQRRFSIDVTRQHDISLCWYLTWKRLACSRVYDFNRKYSLTVSAKISEKRFLQRHLPLSTMAAGKLGGNKPRLLPATSWNVKKKTRVKGKIVVLLPLEYIINNDRTTRISKSNRSVSEMVVCLMKGYCSNRLFLISMLAHTSRHKYTYLATDNCDPGQLTFTRFSVNIRVKNTTLDSLTMPVMVTLYQVSWLMLV